MKYESVAPGAPGSPDASADGDTACIPLAELLAEVEAERAADAERASGTDSDTVTDETDPSAGETEAEKVLPPTPELTPEEAAAVLRDLFPEEDTEVSDETETG